MTGQKTGPGHCHLNLSVSVFQTKVDDLAALDLLAGDFVAPTKASGVQAIQATAAPSTKKTQEVSQLS